MGALLPGALAGTQVAGLLFFLNPHLPFGPLTILACVGFYSSLLGGVSLLLVLPLTRGRRDLVRRWLPIGLTIVLAAAGLSAWIHAFYFSFYLPPGIHRRLLKAAIWLSLAALICFYTVLLHRLRLRPYGRRSRILFGLMALASIYVVLERREAFRPSPPPTLRPAIFQGSQRPQICVVGIEAATLDAILPLVEQGRLPFLGQILREGAYARLSTLRPARRAALWTTLGTGMYPYRHGIVADRIFEAPFLPGKPSLFLLPLGIGFEHWGTWGAGRPAEADAVQVRSVWEILSRLGVATATVGWPLTATADVEIALGDRFFETGGQPRFAHPIDLAERARLFRMRVDEIDPAIASRFGSDPPPAVLQALSEDLWRRDLSLFLLDQGLQVEALAVVLPGLSEISRRYFGGYSAVQFEGDLDPESEAAFQLISAYYAHLDAILGQLWERSREPRILAVVSAHGASSPRGWRRAWRLLRRKPATESFVDLGSDGVLMFLGEGVRPGAMPPAKLVDLVPTLLYSLGFPVARDLDGAILTAAFDKAFLARQPVTFLPSYETLAEAPSAR